MCLFYCISATSAVIQAVVAVTVAKASETESSGSQTCFFLLYQESNFLKNPNLPWLVWLSGLNAGLPSIGSLGQFPVREHSWGVGQVLSGGPHERQPHNDVSLPLFLPLYPFKNK